MTFIGQQSEDSVVKVPIDSSLSGALSLAFMANFPVYACLHSKGEQELIFFFHLRGQTH